MSGILPITSWSYFMKFNYIKTALEPDVILLLVDGRKYKASSNDDYVFLYVAFLQAGHNPVMYDAAGKEVIVETKTVEHQVLRYKK
jgi:hypothetical protein